MIPASFWTICIECASPIEVGDMIENREGEWVHAVCPDPLEEALKPGSGEVVCGRCKLIHRGEC